MLHTPFFQDLTACIRLPPDSIVSAASPSGKDTADPPEQVCRIANTRGMVSFVPYDRYHTLFARSRAAVLLTKFPLPERNTATR